MELMKQARMLRDKRRAKSLGLIFAMNRSNHGTILNGDVQKAKTVWLRVFGDAAANGRE